MSEQLPERIEEDFSTRFRTELYRQYMSDPSGLKLLIKMLGEAKGDSDYKNSPFYTEGMQLGLLNNFTNNLEGNLPWVAMFIVDYMDRNGISSGKYQIFRKICLNETMDLLKAKI
jgi:hypothetical protein